jgi:hypothetical protein
MMSPSHHEPETFRALIESAGGVPKTRRGLRAFALATCCVGSEAHKVSHRSITRSRCPRGSRVLSATNRFVSY